MGASKACEACGHKQEPVGEFDKELGSWVFADLDGDKITVEGPYSDYPTGHVMIGAIHQDVGDCYVYVRLSSTQVRKLAKVLKKYADKADGKETD